MSAPDTSRISPTAHYTGYVWYRHGLSPAALATMPGRLMFHGLRPLVKVGSLGTGGTTLETLLLQRHKLIDHRLSEAIESGQVSQIVEIAGGLTGRGLRFMERYGHRGLSYVEGDLPGMAARKSSLLARHGRRHDGHRVVALNALASDGPLSLGRAVGSQLSPDRGTAVVTEGLLNYFDRESVTAMWARFARFLAGFTAGLYLTDLHLADSAHRRLVPRAFVRLLSLFAAGQVHLHFDGPGDALTSCEESGFREAVLHSPASFATKLRLPRSRGADHTRVLEAWTHAVSAPE